MRWPSRAGCSPVRPSRGRGLGGSGAINGMLATAGDRAQYDAWGWDDADEAFARIRVPLEQVADDELGPGRPGAARRGAGRRDRRR